MAVSFHFLSLFPFSSLSSQSTASFTSTGLYACSAIVLEKRLQYMQALILPFFKKIASLLCRALIPRPIFNTSTESIESSINSHWSFTTFLLCCLQFLVPAQNQSRCVFPTTTQTLMRGNYMNPLLQLRGNFNIILIFALYRYCYRYHYCYHKQVITCYFCNVLATS